MKRYGDRGSPWRTPRLSWKCYELDMNTYINFVFSHQIIITCSRFVFQCRWFHLFIYVVQFTVVSLFVVYVVHRDKATIIFAHHVTMGDFTHCRLFVHVTFKGVVGNDVFVYNKVDVLTDSFGRGGRLSQDKIQCSDPVEADLHVVLSPNFKLAAK